MDVTLGHMTYVHDDTSEDGDDDDHFALLTSVVWTVGIGESICGYHASESVAWKQL